MDQTAFDTMQEQLSQAVETFAPDMEITFKPMFGGMSDYVRERVFATLSDVGLALKLPAEAQAGLLAEPGAKRLQYEPDAPESKQYIVAPDCLRSDPEAFAPWVQRSVEHVLAQPTPKPRRKKE